MLLLGAGVRIAAAALGILTLQRMSGTAAIFASVLALLVAGVVARRRLWVLTRRSRFLFLAVVALYAFATPGSRLWVELANVSPTREGVQLALEHSFRLAGLLAVVAMLLERLDRAQLLGGLLSCLAPLRLVGIRPERAAVRLALALEMATESSPPGAWRQWLRADDSMQNAEIQPIEVALKPWNTADGLVLAVMIVLMELIVGDIG